MRCPDCGAATKRILVHDDEAPFRFHECGECGWDDYDERALEAAKIADALRALPDALEDNEAPAKKPAEKPKAEPKAEKEEAPAKADVASVEDMIQALQKVAKTCGRAKIDEILADFNVKKAGQVAAEDRADVITVAGPSPSGGWSSLSGLGLTS